jgi:hypothetical protein
VKEFEPVMPVGHFFHTFRGVAEVRRQSRFSTGFEATPTLDHFWWILSPGCDYNQRAFSGGDADG